MLRFLTAGEAHGEYLSATLEGFPAGVPVDKEYIAARMLRRRTAPGRFRRQSDKTDSFEIISGLHQGATTGAPVCLLIKTAQRKEDIGESGVPRPGHPDMPGMLKYGIMNSCVIHERASARETAARVAIGAFAVKLNSLLGVEISSRVTELDGVKDPSLDAALAAIEEARARGTTLGGIFEVRACGLPVGLGSHVQPDRRIATRLAAACLSINAVKGFEIGDGFALARARGEEVTDAISPGRGSPTLSNHSGGIDGGMTTGADLVLRCAVKPVPGTRAGTRSVNLITGESVLKSSAAPDTSAVFAAAVVAEHVVSLALSCALLEKFGGDSLAEIRERTDLWRKNTGRFLGL